MVAKATWRTALAGPWVWEARCEAVGSQARYLGLTIVLDKHPSPTMTQA